MWNTKGKILSSRKIIPDEKQGNTWTNKQHKKEQIFG